jgi:hypothetical protein
MPTECSAQSLDFGVVEGRRVEAASNARPSTCMKSSTAHAATWRTGSRNASSTSTPIAPRPPPCGPINCACGSPPWPTCCSVHCVVSACMRPTSPPRLAAPSVSGCSRSVRSCISAFAASRSPWHPPVRPPETGSASPSGSLLPPWPMPRRHERAAATRNRRGTIPRLTEINSSLPPQPANVQPTPRH